MSGLMEGVMKPVLLYATLCIIGEKTEGFARFSVRMKQSFIDILYVCKACCPGKRGGEGLRRTWFTLSCSWDVNRLNNVFSLACRVELWLVITVLPVLFPLAMHQLLQTGKIWVSTNFQLLQVYYGNETRKVMVLFVVARRHMQVDSHCRMSFEARLCRVIPCFWFCVQQVDL